MCVHNIYHTRVINVRRNQLDQAISVVAGCCRETLLTSEMEDDVNTDSDQKCRICFEGGQQGELISPCSCRGTQKFVHRSCLTQWQQTTLVQPNPRRAFECSVCKCLFSIKPSETIWKRVFRWLLPRWARQTFATSVAFVIIFLSRQFPPALQCLVAFAAIYCSSRFSSRFGMADGDPVPAVVPGCFLVADGIPRGSIFYRSVILLLQHDSNSGSLGIIINNPQRVGGPVATFQSIYLTERASPDVAAVSGVDGLFWGRGQPTSGLEGEWRVKVVRGVSGWGARQLDGEVRRGSWRIAAADADAALAVTADAALWQTLYNAAGPAPAP